MKGREREGRWKNRRVGFGRGEEILGREKERGER